MSKKFNELRATVKAALGAQTNQTQPISPPAPAAQSGFQPAPASSSAGVGGPLASPLSPAGPPNMPPGGMGAGSAPPASPEAQIEQQRVAVDNMVAQKSLQTDKVKAQADMVGSDKDMAEAQMELAKNQFELGEAKAEADQYAASMGTMPQGQPAAPGSKL